MAGNIALKDLYSDRNPYVEMQLEDGQNVEGSPDEIAEAMELKMFEKQPWAEGEKNPEIDRGRFSDVVIQNLGVDPRSMNTMEETKKLYQKRLPGLFNHVFRGRKRYGSKLNPNEQNFFAVQAQKLWARTMNDVNNYQKLLFTQYKTQMDRFDRYAKFEALKKSAEQKRQQKLQKEETETELKTTEFMRKAAKDRAGIMKDIENDMRENPEWISNAGIKLNEMGSPEDPKAYQKAFNEERNRRYKDWTGLEPGRYGSKSQGSESKGVAIVGNKRYTLQADGTWKKSTALADTDKQWFVDQYAKIEKDQGNDMAESTYNKALTYLKNGDIDGAKKIFIDALKVQKKPKSKKLAEVIKPPQKIKRNKHRMPLRAVHGPPPSPSRLYESSRTYRQ